MANTHTTLTALLTAIAEKIRKKTGSTAAIVADNFPAMMETILTPADGSIPTKTASDMSVSGATVTAPAGYYASAASKSVAAAGQATPSITVDSAGKITASATQTEGYVQAGTKSATKQLTTQPAKTVTPGTSDQTAVASGLLTIGAVKVKGDANLKAENIVDGKSIFNVAGSAEPASALAPEIAAQDQAIASQDDLIAQIVAALNGKVAPDGGSNIETCTVNFVSLDGNWPISGVCTYIRTYTDGEDVYGSYYPGKDAFGKVVDTVIPDVVCGSYMILKRNASYPVFIGTDNVEEVFTQSEDVIFKITAGPGETVMFNMMYNDF